MIAAAGAPAFWDRILSDLPMSLALLLSAVVTASALAAAVLLVLARRGRRREAQEIVRLLEEMRSGRPRARLDLDPRSPFASIADSVNRLGQDLAVRWSRAETATEGFHALQEAARGYAVVATDADGDLRGFSPGAVALFGWDEDAVAGRNASLLFDESSWKEILPKLARKSLRERGVDTRALMARRDGTRFHARLNVRMLRGHGEEHTGFLLVVQDVTEQVRVESELRAAESRSRGMLEDLPGSVALVQRGRVVYANAALKGLLDLPERETIGSFLRDRIATADVLVVQELLARLESGAPGATAESLVTLRDAAGRPGREVRLMAAAHVHEGQTAVLVTLRDETAERRILRALEAHERGLEAALDTWEDGVAVVEDEPAGPRVRLVNDAFLAAFGLARRDLLGAPEGDLLRLLRGHGDEGAAAAACLAAASTEAVRDVAHTSARSLRVWAAPLGPGVSGRLLAVRDVTDAVRADRQRAADVAGSHHRQEAAEAAYAKLQVLHRELDARRIEAERLNQELRTLDGMKSDLLANVSHELQTPLVSIRGYTEMILKGRLGAINDEQKRGLTLALKNIDRLIAMIDNLLAFARRDREAAALTIQTFPLAPVVDEALALLRERIEAKGLRAGRQIDDASLTVRADRDKVLQVVLNLLSNAVKFNRDGGAIEISARPGKPGFALVQVRDTGVGIAKDDLEKIFDRFYQAGAEGQAPREGTGIGLAIVRNILRSHGCVIHATSEPGVGTTFAFTLPLAGERHAANAADADAKAPEATGTAAEAPAPIDEPDRPRLRIIRRA